LSAIKNIASGIWKPGGSISEIHYATLRASQAALAEVSYFALGKPDVVFSVLGGMLPLPLFRVQRLEVARSQDLLQYRAIGGEFLAQQQGGHWGVRIDALLTGNTQMLTLSALQGLKAWTRTRASAIDPDAQDWNQIDSSTITSKGTTTSSSKLNVTKDNIDSLGRDYNVFKGALFSHAGRTSIFDFKSFSSASAIWSESGSQTLDMNFKDINKPTITATNKLNTEYAAERVNDMSVYDLEIDKLKNKNNHYYLPEDYSWGNTEWHNTFTLVTRDEILPEMYIETLAYRIVQKHGTKAIEVNILLRHFKPPDAVVSSKFVLINEPSGYESFNSDSVLHKGNRLYFLRQVKKKPRIPGTSSLIKKVNFGIQTMHVGIQQAIRYTLFNLYSPERLKYRRINTSSSIVSKISDAIYGGIVDVGQKFLGVFK